MGDYFRSQIGINDNEDFLSNPEDFNPTSTLSDIELNTLEKQLAYQNETNNNLKKELSYQINTPYENYSEGPSGGQVVGSIGLEVGVGIASEGVALAAATSAAAATSGAAVTGVGAIIPLVAFISTYAAVKFGMGTAASLVAQKGIEQQEDISWGRTMVAGAANMLPGSKNVTASTRALKYLKTAGIEGTKGAVIGGADVTARAMIDEDRLPTLKELGFGITAGGVIGGGLGSGLSAAKDYQVFGKLSQQSKNLWTKMQGKTAKEIDAMHKKGEIYQEEFEDLIKETDSIANSGNKTNTLQDDASDVANKKLNEEDAIPNLDDFDTITDPAKLIEKIPQSKQLEISETPGFIDRIRNHPILEAARARAAAGKTTLEDAEALGQTVTNKKGRQEFSDEWKKTRRVVVSDKDGKQQEGSGWESIKDMIYGRNGSAVKNKEIVIIGGNSGAGKSGVANALAEKRGAIILDSDDVKVMLPEFDGGFGAGNVHMESKFIHDELLQTATLNGDNIILPVVGTSKNSIANNIQKFKRLGYDVTYIHVDIPQNLSQVRTFRRFLNTGRFIDPEYVDTQYSKTKTNYEEGVQNADRAIKFTNKRNQSEYIEHAGGELDDFRNIIEAGDLKGFPGYKPKRSAKTDADGNRSGGDDARQDGGVGPREGKKSTINDPDDGIPDGNVKDAIELTKTLLVNQEGGRAALVTRRVKETYRRTTQSFLKDVNQFFKTGDEVLGRKLIGQMDDYIEFDRVISKKDYAQGSALVANRRNAATHTYRSGISADGNTRTANLKQFKNMLIDFVENGHALPKGSKTKIRKQLKDQAQGKAALEKLDDMMVHFSKTFNKKRTGELQQVIDSYFTIRMTQMLNQLKTGFVGVPSAAAMSIVRPILNTPYQISQAIAQKDLGIKRRLVYGASELIATQEYVFMLTKHLGDVTRSVGKTIARKGESSFLYRDRHSYKQDTITSADELSHRQKQRLKEAERRVDARAAEPQSAKAIGLKLKANILNNPVTKAPMFLYDYGLSLIGGLEEVSLIAHSLRKARAEGIRKGIVSGRKDWNKAADEYVETTLDRTSGTMQAKYDPEFKEIYNTARRDHFRAMDMDPDDIRRDGVDAAVTALNKIAGNQTEASVLVKMLFPFIGVPARAVGMTLKMVPPLQAAKLAGMAGARLDKAVAGARNKPASFGKYNKKIRELEIEIDEQRKIANGPEGDEATEAKNKIAELENQAADVRDIQKQADYEEIGMMAIGTGMMILGYEMAKAGQIVGTMGFLTKDQKQAVNKIQGGPKSYKMVFDDSSYDYRYFDPIKGALAFGADWYHYHQLKKTADIDGMDYTNFAVGFATSILADMPTSRGGKAMLNIFSQNEYARDRGMVDIMGSAYPVPAEFRRAQRAGDSLQGDPLQGGNPMGNALTYAMGTAAANYKLTVLGEPKLREDMNAFSYVLPFGPQRQVRRTPLDDVLLEDALTYTTVSDVTTSVKGIRLKDYENAQGKTLYSVYGELINTVTIAGKNQRQALEAIVNSTAFKTAYAKGYTQDDSTGSWTNPGIEMLKETISEYRKAAREEIFDVRKNRARISGFINRDTNMSIFDVIEQREAFNEPGSKTQGLLETLGVN